MADSRPAVAEQPTERAQAFLRLADQHLDAAYRLARAILRDPTDAQDATHDAFEQAWRKWSTLRDPARFEPWFDRILVNTCRDRLRSGRRHARDISVEVAISAGDPFAQAHDRDVLASAIAALSAEHRVVVALRYYRDLPVDGDRQPARHPGRHSPLASALRPQAPPRVDRRRRRQGSCPMTDRELEQRLRSWYRAEIPARRERHRPPCDRCAGGDPTTNRSATARGSGRGVGSGSSPSPPC